MSWRLFATIVVLGTIVINGGGSAAPQSQEEPAVVAPPGQEAGPPGPLDRAALPAPKTADQARDLVARLSDREAGELLIAQLETPEAAADAPTAPPASMVFDLQANMYALRNRLRGMIAALPELSSLGSFMVMRITKGYEPSHIWAIGWYVLVILAGAVMVEAAFRRVFRPLVRQLTGLPARSEFGKLAILLLRALIGLLAIAAFAAAAAFLSLFLYKGHEVARIAFWSMLAFVILVRLSAIGLEVVLAVRQPTLRIPDIDDAAARRLYLSFLLLIAMASGSAMFANFLEHIGVEPDPLLAVNELLLLVNVSVQIAVIWAQRSDIARLLGAHVAGTAGPAKGVEALVARHWHVFAVTCLLLMAVFSTAHRLLTGETQAQRVFPTLAVLIALPLLDGLLRMIARQFFDGRDHRDGRNGRQITPSEAKGIADMAVGSPSANAPGDTDKPAANRGKGAGDGATYGRVMLRNGRILLVLLSLIALAEIWDLQLQAVASHGLGARMAGSLFDIVVTLILASAAWGIVKTAINRNLPHEGLDALALAEGEVGGTGLSRIETLLPLLRKFLYIALIVIVTMIVISSLGINIGPLLAGAGVIGIAVGFGAQTLVRDVISGVFFLIDDAFRVGEYIDVGEGKGTVERMSVRSLMLRHHLGPINTIPFGAIQRVTNYSRDWVIMKLEMRVPFETDLEKLRKLVKRVGVEMMDDPTFGPNFIQPLKSQGAHHMDDSSFVIRVKFMAKPGEQFVLRREVFRRLQEAFKANGIKFAPRRVIVDTSGVPAAAATAAAAVDDGGGSKSPAT